jgi:hypothetical protein
MNLYPVHPRACAGLCCLVVVALFSGCASTTEPPPGAKIVDGDKYVTRDAPVGSHMKQHVKVSDLKDPNIAPTRTGVITSETDTLMLPPTAGEIRGAGLGGRGP